MKLKCLFPIMSYSSIENSQYVGIVVLNYPCIILKRCSSKPYVLCIGKVSIFWLLCPSTVCYFVPNTVICPISLILCTLVQSIFLATKHPYSLPRLLSIPYKAFSPSHSASPPCKIIIHHHPNLSLHHHLEKKNAYFLSFLLSLIFFSSSKVQMLKIGMYFMYTVAASLLCKFTVSN